MINRSSYALDRLNTRQRRMFMAVRYNKLWKILIDRKMKKKDLQEAAHLTRYQMLKLARDENITTDVVGSICKALDCTADEIMEFYDE